MIYPETKLFPISESIKLEKKLLFPKIQWLDRHRMQTFPLQKQKNVKKKKVISSKQFQNSEEKIPSGFKDLLKSPASGPTVKTLCTQFSLCAQGLQS
jgi:hypothetical protein